MYPALLHIVSSWYKRHEVQKRFAALYLLSGTIAGVSPILAFILIQLDGKANIPGWRWIFVSAPIDLVVFLC